MATYRKRNGKWQAIVRHKDIGTRARSFHTKQAAIKWAAGEERRMTEGLLGLLKPTDVTLGRLLQRYLIRRVASQARCGNGRAAPPEAHQRLFEQS